MLIDLGFCFKSIRGKQCDKTHTKNVLIELQTELFNLKICLELYLVKKAAAAILSSILKSSSIFFSSKRWTFFKSSIPSNEWKLFPVSSFTTVGSLVFVFARWRLVSIQAKIAEADRRPWRTAPLCNRAHIGSRFRNKYAIFPMAVWSAISFNRRHVDLINSLAFIEYFLSFDRSKTVPKLFQIFSR